MVEWERVQRTMEILKWLGGAAGSLAQNVSVGTPTVSVGLPTSSSIVVPMRNLCRFLFFAESPIKISESSKSAK